MNINFKIKHFNGLHSGLYMQIIPSTLEDNPNYQNSIVFDETAFSLIERFFLEGENKWSHWGKTYLDSNKIEMIIHKLEQFRDDLDSKDMITSQNILLIFEERTEHFIKHFAKYKSKAVNMINQTLVFLKHILDNNIAGITVIGV